MSTTSIKSIVVTAAKGALLAGGALALVLFSTAPSHAKKSCALAKGTGMGLTQDIAKQMASAAVTSSANTWAAGAPVKMGAVSYNCTAMNQCSAQARVCKG
jgi:hypothetical protein